MIEDLHTKQHRMLETPVNKLILSLSIPSIIIMLITAVYNLADTYFVSGLGTSATAAIGVVFSLMGLIQAIGFLFGHGSGNYMSRKLGAEEFDRAEAMASTGFFLSLFSGVMLAIIGLIFLDPFMQLLGASETMLPYARDYARWILIAAPFMTSSLTLNNQLRFLASAKMAVYGMVAGAVLNIGLDPLFVYVFHWGAGGAGLATCISQIVGFSILLATTRRKGNIPIRWKNFTPNRYHYREIIRGGSPSLLRQMCNSLGILYFNHAAGAFGDQAVAAISIVQRVSMFAIQALLGFGQGFQPVCGFNYGAKRYDRVIKGFMFCLKIISVSLIIIAIFGAIFAPEIIAAFRADDPDVIAIGTITLRFQCITIPFMGFVVLCNMMLQTIGETGKASLIAIARSGLFLIPSILILVSSFGLSGVETAQLVADVLTLLLTIPLVLGTFKDMRMKLDRMKSTQ